MKVVPVFTMQQIAEMSVEKLMETIRRDWNAEWPSPARMLPPPSSVGNMPMKFFIKTKSETINLINPPTINMIDSQGKS
jgi:hypothetical protein